MAKSTKTNFLDQLIGIKEPTVETMEHSQVLKQNLEAQMSGVENDIVNLKAQLAKKKEYLANLEGGLEVIDELTKHDSTHR